MLKVGNINELKRNGKKTREQLTFSDTYLVLDNLRNYEGKAENSLRA